MKFKVTYSRKCIFEGTIEASSEDEARKLWDEGFTPYNETEVSDNGEDLIDLEPA